MNPTISADDLRTLTPAMIAAETAGTSRRDVLITAAIEALRRAENAAEFLRMFLDDRVPADTAPTPDGIDPECRYRVLVAATAALTNAGRFTGVALDHHDERAAGFDPLRPQSHRPDRR
jgi:hypothetical protein